MTHYATEQLARDRWTQFSREASGDNRIRVAMIDAAYPPQSSVRRLPLRRAASLMSSLRAAILPRTSRWTVRREATTSTVASSSAPPIV